MKKSDLQPFETAIIRTSLFSWEDLPKFEQWLDKEENPFNEEETKAIKEAIYLASPNLYNEMNKWEEGKITDQVEVDKLKASLYKYFSRMCTRCTPFGLFAGCGTLQIGEENKIQLDTKSVFARNTRLDMFFLCELAEKLMNKSSIKPYLKYYPSSGIYTREGELRYVEYTFKSGNRIHQIAEVEQEEYLELILNEAKEGKRIANLAHILVDDEVTFEEAEEFINDLIDAQLLVGELDPSVTGDDFLEILMNKVNALQTLVSEEHLNEVNEIAQKLKAIKKQLLTIDQKVGNPVAVYADLEKELDYFEIKFDKSKLIQVDMFQEYEAGQLDQAIIDEVKEGILFMHKLTPFQQHKNLEEFNKRFYEKYETKPVSLANALDIESGLGYPNEKDGDVSPLVQNIPIGQTGGGAQNNGVSQALIKRVIADKKEAIHLDDLKFNGDGVGQLSDTLSVMLRPVTIEGKTYYSFSHAGGTSAANLLGRFAGSESSILNLVKEITAYEAERNTEGIVAEIAHLPQSRVGNILMRPKIREYEIPYLANSHNLSDKKIDLNDLYLVSDAYEIQLFSKKHHQPVFPKLTTAHNYSFNALPIYQFLCDYQHKKTKSGVMFSWGDLKNSLDYLPRVTYKNILLAPAEWKFSKDDLKEVYKAEKEEKLRLLRERLEEKGIPDKVLLVEGDNELYFDFSSDLSANVFLLEMKKKSGVILSEALFSETDAFATDKNGKHYNQQIAICFKNQSEKKPQKLIAPSAKKNTIRRSFALGSEWLYFKVYCGTTTADQILAQQVYPLVEQLKSKGWITKWFFIRYSDPHKHFRIRFLCPNTQNLGAVIDEFNRFMQAPLDNGKLWKIVTDQYEREIERYGTYSMEDSETIFCYNSQAILNCITLMQNNATEEDFRWLLGSKMIDALLNAFGLNAEEKKELMEPIKDGFAQEFGAHKGTRKFLAIKFRNERKSISAVMSGECKSAYLPLLAEVEKYQKAVGAIAEHVKTLLKESDIDLNGYLHSHIHMLMNRLFRSKQRLHEMVLYDLQYQFYKAEIAKEKALLRKQQATVSA